MTQDKKIRCFRCQELLDDLEVKDGKGKCSIWKYCENCYDHMFVNWNNVFAGSKK